MFQLIYYDDIYERNEDRIFQRLKQLRKYLKLLESYFNLKFLNVTWYIL